MTTPTETGARMQTHGEQRDLRQIWAILVRRRWILYLAVFAGCLVALVGSFLITPLYRATVTLQIERQNPDILTFRDLAQVDYSWAAYGDFYETQYQIISSLAVARKAVERSGVIDHPEFPGGDRRPGLLARLRSLLPHRGAAPEPDPLERAAERVRGGLEVTPVRNSQLVRVSWVSPDPELAATVANAVADAYVHFNLLMKYSTTEQASEFLVNQIHELKDEISEIEARLQTYGESKRIVSIDQSSNITLQALKDIAEERTAAQTRLAKAAARRRAVTDAEPDALTEVMNSNLIGRLRQEYASYEAQYSEKSKTFKDDWPGMQTLKSRLDQARERLELETERIAGQVRQTAEAEYRNALAAVKNLDDLLGSHEDAAQRLKRDSVEYSYLLNEAQEKQQTLNALHQRQNEMALSSRLRDLDTTTSNIRVVERARRPKAAFRPNTRFNLALGLALGLSLGVGLAFFVDYMDNTIGSADELKRVVPLPLMAIVPRHEAHGSAPARVRRRAAAEAAPQIDLVTHRDGRTAAAEAYRELRTSLLLSHAGQPPRLIMVTSALPEEGKTATAINLATVLAQLGRRVLLVDTDLRRPRLNKVFDVARRRGISTYLSGLEPHPGELISSTGIDNLDLLPSGPVPPNPSELLNSEIFLRSGEVFGALGYDHVLFDSPPVLSVADSLIIANTVEVGILVVRAHRTPRASVRLAADKLSQAANASFGVVLNGLDPDSYGPASYRYQYRSVYGEPDEPAADSERKRAGGAGA